ncbi:MAG TPA: hypothetical protein VH475_26405, partial [Tepidisphaeraceae bacterium]
MTIASAAALMAAMEAIFVIVDIIALAAFAVMTYQFPRRFGLAGVFVAEIVVVLGCFAFYLAGGGWHWHELGSIFLVALAQGCIFNCVFLPLAIVGLWRRRSQAARARRGFDVVQ